MTLPSRAAWAGIWTVSVMLPACAGARPQLQAAEPPVFAVAALAPAAVERLRALAPDYFARAERAEQRALRAADPAAASDGAACAALLLDAAQAEADRIELERQLIAEAVHRDELQREIAREEYARLAAELPVERPATAVADLAPASDARSKRTPAQNAQRTAADAYLRRARLELAAARALGAEPGALAQAERRVRDAGQDPAQARAAQDAAGRVLAAARAGRPKP